MTSRRRASGNMKIDFCVGDTSPAEGVEKRRAYLPYVNFLYLDFGQACSKSFKMLVEREDFAVVAANDLINSVAEKYPPVQINGSHFS